MLRKNIPPLRHYCNSKSSMKLKQYSDTINTLRSHFLQQGFIETNPQSRLSILAACEDPWTVSTMNHSGEIWPLPQTGQMWLEHDLLKNPDFEGVFCVTTSYRDEPHPIKGRHEKTFPMFEFESWGGIDDMVNTHVDMLKAVGFKEPFAHEDYGQMAEKYNVLDIDHETEKNLCDDHGDIVFLQNFPIESSFWNMKKTFWRNKTKKIDVIIHGQETIGSAERSCEPEDMREMFHSISNGEYASLLFDKFGEVRVEEELEKYLSLVFKPRFGAGIGVGRLIRGMELSNII